MRFNFSLFLISLCFISCKIKPIEPQKTDVCANCTMPLQSRPFVAETIKQKNTKLFFESIECLSAYQLKNTHENFIATWVTSFDNDGTWVEVDKAFFVLSSQIKSPMGLGLVGFQSKMDAKRVAEQANGTVLNWIEVNQYVKKAWDL